MRQIVAAAVLGILIGGAMCALLVGWKLALAAVVIDVAVVLAGLAARTWRRASHKLGEIFRDELDEDPDPFATRLRVEYRNQPTDTGETR